jgi:hypothetical protein
MMGTSHEDPNTFLHAEVDLGNPQPDRHPAQATIWENLCDEVTTKPDTLPQTTLLSMAPSACPNETASSNCLSYLCEYSRNEHLEAIMQPEHTRTVASSIHFLTF